MRAELKKTEDAIYTGWPARAFLHAVNLARLGFQAHPELREGGKGMTLSQLISEWRMVAAWQACARPNHGRNRKRPQRTIAELEAIINALGYRYDYRQQRAVAI
jgi:hypothetical protein